MIESVCLPFVTNSCLFSPVRHKQLFIFSWLMTGIVEAPLPFSS